MELQDMPEQDIRALLSELGIQFSRLRRDRHEFGQVKYGEFTYLGNDIIRMTIEELADMANYAEYQAAKLLLLQMLLEDDPRLKGLAKDDQIVLGLESFKGTGEGWNKP